MGVVPARVPAMELHRIHIVNDGDRLDLISYQYLKSVKYWKLLAAFNGLIDPSVLVVGSELKIPTLSSVQSALKKCPEYSSTYVATE